MGDCGWERGLTLLCLAPGRSKILWLHSFLSFLYFITNLLFMTHHCSGFVLRKSSKVMKRAPRPALPQRGPSPAGPLQSQPLRLLSCTAVGSSPPLALRTSTWHPRC